MNAATIIKMILEVISLKTKNIVETKKIMLEGKETLVYLWG